MKRQYYSLLIGCVVIVISYWLYHPVDIEIENSFKKTYLYVLPFSLITLWVKYKTPLFKNNRFCKLFFYIFILSLSSGIGIILKTYFTNFQWSYIGLFNMFASFPFLLLCFRFNLNKTTFSK